MSSLSESQLVKRISELNNSTQSVQTLSLWLIHHRRRSKQVVDVIYKEIKRTRSARKLVNILYLINDVLQTSRKKGPEYHRDFFPTLIGGFAHVARHADDKTLCALRRIMDVWRSRAVYDSSMMERLAYSVTSNLTKKQMGVWSGASSASASGGETSRRPSRRDGAGASTSGSSHRSRSNRSRQQSRKAAAAVASSLQPSTPPPDLLSEGEATPAGADETGETAASGDQEQSPFPLRLSPRNSPVDADTGTGDDAEDGERPAPDTEELITSVKELDNAPSTDAAVREEIAALPPEVADVSHLDTIQTKAAGDELSQVVDHAHELLNQYNARLKAELEQRDVTLKKLRSYLHCQREKVEQDALILEQWKEKLSKLEHDRNELKEHVTNLPDLNHNEPLQPLPSLGDLFTNK